MDIFLIDRIKDARWFVGVKDANGQQRKIKAVEKAILLQVAINKKCDIDVFGLMAKSSVKNDEVKNSYFNTVSVIKSNGRRVCDLLESSRGMFKAELARVCGLSFRRIMRYVNGLVEIGALKEDDNGYLTFPEGINGMFPSKFSDMISVRARA